MCVCVCVCLLIYSRIESLIYLSEDMGQTLINFEINGFNFSQEGLIQIFGGIM